MNLFIKRTSFPRLYTIGEFAIEDNPFCDTLEPPLEVDGLYNQHGLCCIPPGTYKVTMTYSPKHERVLPLLHDVPGRDSIEIHAGSYPHDTQGCILLGVNNIPGMLTNSRITVDKLCDILGRETNISITII